MQDYIDLITNVYQFKGSVNSASTANEVLLSQTQNGTKLPSMAAYNIDGVTYLALDTHWLERFTVAWNAELRGVEIKTGYAIYQTKQQPKVSSYRKV